MIITTTDTVNTSDLEARKLTGKTIDVGPGRVELKGWGVYNTALNAWVTFPSSVLVGKVGSMVFEAKRPYTLDTKKVAKQVADSGLVEGTHEWIIL